MLSVAHACSTTRGDTSARRGDLDRFRQEFYTSLTARADALFELTDALLCADGPVRSLVDLTLVAEHRRGHGAMYDALGHGRVEPERFRRTLASLPVPRTVDGRIVLAVESPRGCVRTHRPARIGCSATSTVGAAVRLS